MRSVIRFFVDNAKVVNLMVLGVTIAGLLIFIYGRKEGFPEIKFDQVIVTTIYPGASAKEVEKLVTRKIEDAVATVNGGKKLTSKSLENVSSVLFEVEADQSKNMTKILSDLKSAVDRVVPELPADVKKPDVMEISFDLFPAIAVIVSGDIPEVELREVAKRFADDAKKIRGVGQVSKTGYRDREIWVECDPARLRAMDVDLADVIMAIRLRSINLPAGSLTLAGREYLIRTVGQFASLDQVKSAVVRANDEGRIVTIADVAQVTWAFEKQTQITRAEGSTGIRLGVLKKKTGDIIQVSDAVKALIKKYEGEKLLPGGARLFYADDQAYYVKKRLKTLAKDALLGLVFVFICLIVFFDLSTTLFTAVAVPVSFCGGMLAASAMGITLNLMSMFGFIIVVGLLVDNGIVVAENIYRHLEQGDPLQKAVIDGASEVSLPVFGSVLTIILAFLPLAFLPGIFGKFLSVIPIVLTITLTISLAEAFFVLPGHIHFIQSWRMKRHPAGAGAVSHDESGWFFRLKAWYERFIRAVLTKPKRNLALITLVSFGVAGVLMSRIPFQLFSGSIDEYTVTLEGPVYGSLQQSQAFVDQAEARLRQHLHKEVREFISTVGYVDEGMGPRIRSYLGGIRLIMNPDARIQPHDFLGVVNRELAQVPGVVKFTVGQRRNGPPQNKPVEAKIFGEDLTVMRQIAADLKGILSNTPNTTSVGDSFEEGKDEFILNADERAAAVYGLSLQSAAFALRYAYEGGKATTLNTMGSVDEDVDVVVKYRGSAQRSLEELKGLNIKNRMGRNVPISSFATISNDRSVSVIDRERQSRIVRVTAELKKASDRQYSGQKINAMLQGKIPGILKKYPPTYSVELGGEQEDTRELITGTLIALGVALAAIFVMLVALFRSFAQPIIIMLVVPFGIVGVSIGLSLPPFDPLGLLPLIGLVALTGTIVSGTIVMVSFINANRAKGLSRLEATIKGSAGRLRPLIATHATAIFGLIPLAYGIGGREPFLAPMAVALAWGLAFTTVITLVILPCIYLVVDGATEWMMTKLGLTYELPWDMEAIGGAEPKEKA
ncbi:MAG: efflux RND transporter permease subunit [Spirochaetes bacterium]|nr:efflux RND transporter permease subunit [Spirochaetota bacterium]